MTDSKENWTDSCERSTEYYMDINDSTAFGRGSDVVENIFGKLWSQREIYGTLSILQQYLPDDVTIAEKQAELLKWLEQPTLIA